MWPHLPPGTKFKLIGPIKICMKKIYIASMMTVAVAAASCSEAKAEKATTVFPETLLSGKVAKAPVSKAEGEWKEIGEGTYSDVVICNEFAGYYNDPVKVTIEQSVSDPNVYRVLNPWPGIPEIWPNVTYKPEHNFMIVDVSDPDFVLVREGLLPIEDAEEGEVHYKSMTQFAVDVMGSKEKGKETLLAGPLAACNITMADGMITFPMNCFGVMYPNGVNEVAGQWMPTMGSYSGYLVLPGGQFKDEWTSMGTGRILDGFVWTLFENEAPEEKDVEVFKHNDVAGVYKVKGAFVDSDPNAADLVIDARDPDWVRIDKFDTRIKTEYGNLYILSVSANAYASYDDMVSFNPEFADRNITLKNNVIDIPKKAVYAHFPDTGDFSVMVNDRSLPSYIKLPSAEVEGIGADIEYGETEYYDLQGMRVKNPAAGQIVIARRGNKVSKMVVR